jgi:hypothetical protein
MAAKRALVVMKTIKTFKTIYMITLRASLVAYDHTAKTFLEGEELGMHLGIHAKSARGGPGV